MNITVLFVDDEDNVLKTMKWLRGYVAPAVLDICVKTVRGM